MWIAKPLSALSRDEKRAWAQVQDSWNARGAEVPLSQTLTWGSAIRAASDWVYLVFSPQEQVGGLLFATPIGGQGGGLFFECINGPLLDWDDPGRAPRQLATFAMAVSKLSPRFQGMSLRPRWSPEQRLQRLPGLPVPEAAVQWASTWVVPVEGTDEKQREAFHPRLRRTLKQSEQYSISVEWLDPDRALLKEFVHHQSRFGAGRGFIVPPLSWFEALVGQAADHEKIRFKIGRARLENQARAEILVALTEHQAHYLFGWEERMSEVSRSVSVSASAHLRALGEIRRLGLRHYDLNGYWEGAASDHPYRGVAEFKRQWGGKSVAYAVPEFRIE